MGMLMANRDARPAKLCKARTITEAFLAMSR